MKTILLYCNSFGYTPKEKTLDFVPDADGTKKHKDVQVLFIHLEKEDEKNENSVFKKLVKQLKWIMKKNNTSKLVIHSFANLSYSKADPEFSLVFLNRLDERMSNSEVESCQTPFGYFLDLQVDAPGFSLARVFKQF